MEIEKGLKENLWDEVYKKYPNIDDVLEELHKKQMDYLDALRELDEKYPVEGYFWDCDPNNVGLEDIIPFHLKSNEWLENVKKSADKRLEKQLKCVKGKHHFQKITSDILWCSYCGTVKKNDKFFYPDVPHFLPKDK